jgi:hypothetical protein
MDYKIDGIGVGRDPQSIKRTETYRINFDKIGNSSENIKVFSNFMSIEICEEILSIKGSPNKNDNEFWSNRVHENAQITSIAKPFRDKIISVIEKEYSISVSPKNEPGVVHWGPGVEMGLHVDDLGKESYHMASLIYLNEDYDGGEIYFQTHDVTIKPKTGDLVMFPGNLNYAHKVLPVLRGDRYTMPFWFNYS